MDFVSKLKLNYRNFSNTPRCTERMRSRAIFLAQGCDFSQNPRADQLRFQRERKIPVRFLRNPAALHKVSNMFEAPAISRQKIALKASLVYTGDLKQQLECDKNCTESGILGQKEERAWKRG